jgi:hypothetical protein
MSYTLSAALPKMTSSLIQRFDDHCPIALRFSKVGDSGGNNNYNYYHGVVVTDSLALGTNESGGDKLDSNMGH